jgi:hypothetical protein
MSFSPHHVAQRSDPTGGRLSDSLPRPSKKDSLSSQQNSSTLDTSSFNKQGSFQNSPLSRKTPGHQSTSSHVRYNIYIFKISYYRRLVVLLHLHYRRNVNLLQVARLPLQTHQLYSQMAFLKAEIQSIFI